MLGMLARKCWYTILIASAECLLMLPSRGDLFWPWCRGLHFLAVQKDEDAEDSAGLWLLQARDLPKI